MQQHGMVLGSVHATAHLAVLHVLVDVARRAARVREAQDGALLLHFLLESIFVDDGLRCHICIHLVGN